jgi:hypothetical protein
MRRRFMPASDPRRTACLLARLAARCDVYVGAALRDGQRHGGRAGIGASHLVWVESDSAQTVERLPSLTHPPSMAIASGTPGHLQLYWLLDRRYPLGEVESANRALARALAGDQGCADGARILRPPGTRNHKHDPPRKVTLLALRPAAAVALARLTAGLATEPIARKETHPFRTPRGLRTRVDRELLSVPAHRYVHRLTGRAANPEGKVLCPFHEDHNPSLQLYEDGSFYCFGSACRRGGTIFDFAAELWGIRARGAGFLQLRTRLADELLTAQEGP